MQNLKKAFSIFTLSVFLLHYACRDIHVFSHLNDIRCTSKNGHFHPSKPHCFLCDLTDDSTGLPFFYLPDLPLNEPVFSNFFLPATTLPLYEKDFEALRAPPLLV